MDLRYRSFAEVDDLQVGECTIHNVAASDDPGTRSMWFHVTKNNGKPEVFRVLVRPNARHGDTPAGRPVWGLTRTSEGIWQIDPSINYGDDVWHETPRIVGVPDGEAWIAGSP